jgi:hypothetical protein
MAVEQALGRLSPSPALVRSCPLRPMSGSGQSRHFDPASLTSGLPKIADILRVGRHVSEKVPQAGIKAKFTDVILWPVSAY